LPPRFARRAGTPGTIPGHRSRTRVSSDLKDNVTSPAIWLRAVYMVVMAIAWTLAELVLAAVVLLQFLLRLFTGGPNANLLAFGRQLAAYAYNIFLFLTFNTEERPFPFCDWDASSRPWPPAPGGGNEG
jgi:hypothetical protein